MDIIEEIVNELKRRGMWFTTELDPVFAGFGRIDRYIKIDEYGYITDENEKARIEKEVTDYIGDGAVDYIDAINIWIDNAFQKGQIAFKENLVTSFKDRPVIDNIDVAEVNQESHSFTRLKESKEDDVNKDQLIRSRCASIGTNLTFLRQELPFNEDEARKFQDYIKEEYMSLKELLNLPDEEVIDYAAERDDYTVSKIKLLKTLVDNDFNYVGQKEIKTEDFKFTTLKEVLYDKLISNSDWLDAFLNKKEYDWKISDKVILKDIITNGLDDDTVSEILDTIDEQEASDWFDVSVLEPYGAYAINGAAYGDALDELGLDTPLTKKVMEKAHEILGILKENKHIKVESKQPLVEENQKSKQLIDNLLTSDNFNADTPQGKVVLRTSKVFNELSKDGYDVQISFDNGEGIASIAVDKKGGAIVVPISDNNKLNATLSGNIPLNVENMNAITDVFTSIASL